MVDLQYVNGWVLIAQKYFLWEQSPEQGILHLCPMIGEEVIYQTKRTAFKVDFPWQYDINDDFIFAYAGKDSKLNYLLNINNKRVLVLQTPSLLQDEEIAADVWLYTNDFALSVLDKLELEGERQKVEFEV